MGGVECGGVDRQSISHIDQATDEFLRGILDFSDLDLLEGGLFGLPGQSVETPPYCEEDIKKEKKRRIDYNYRQRQKAKKQKLFDDVRELRTKIDELKDGKVSYQQDIDLCTKGLETKAGEKREQKAFIEKLKGEVAKQNKLLNRLHCNPPIQKEVLECPDEQLQRALLKNARAVFDENCNCECLEKEIEQLEMENMRLEVENQALREKMMRTL